MELVKLSGGYSHLAKSFMGSFAVMIGLLTAWYFLLPRRTGTVLEPGVVRLDKTVHSISFSHYAFFLLIVVGVWGAFAGYYIFGRFRAPLFESFEQDKPSTLGHVMTVLSKPSALVAVLAGLGASLGYVAATFAREFDPSLSTREGEQVSVSPDTYDMFSWWALDVIGPQLATLTNSWMYFVFMGALSWFIGVVAVALFVYLLLVSSLYFLLLRTAGPEQNHDVDVHCSGSHT